MSAENENKKYFTLRNIPASHNKISWNFYNFPSLTVRQPLADSTDRWSIPFKFNAYDRKKSYKKL